MQLLVEYNHKNYPVKITPVGVLKDVIVQVCQQIKPPLTPGTCNLYHKGQKLDITTPFRFLNIPQGTKLELKSSEGVKLGFQSSELSPDQPENLNQNPSNITSAENVLKLNGQSQQQAQLGNANQEKNIGEIFNQRKIIVFSRQDLVELGQGQGQGQGQNEEEGDEFFEFTVEDYYVMQASYAKEHKKQSEWFKTKAQREKEAAERAHQFSEVLIRVQFPDDVIVQISFEPLEKIVELKQVVEKIIKPQFRKNFYMFTAPPKEIITNFEQSFWNAGLVPAAYVHFRVKDVDLDQQNGFLLQEVVELKGKPPARKIEQPIENIELNQKKISQIEQGKLHEEERKKESGKGDGVKKLPKWFKGGK